MKKLFISMPMRGRTPEKIIESYQKLKALAELIIGEELELIDSYLAPSQPEGQNNRLWYLGESIKALGGADVFIGCANTGMMFCGCSIEFRVAHDYGIESIILPEDLWMSIMPDAAELCRRYWEIRAVPTKERTERPDASSSIRRSRKTMVEIKACPFCGCEAELITRQGKTHDGRVYDCFRVTCKNVDCEVTTFDFLTPKKAARVWNRRVNNG